MDFTKAYSALLFSLVTFWWDGGGPQVKASLDIESCYLIKPRGQPSKSRHQAITDNSEYTMDNSQVTTGLQVKIEDDQDYVTCHLRTLQPELDFENLTVSLPIDLEKVNVLQIQCSDLLFFESIFSAGQLSGFGGVFDLTVDQCKVKEVTSDAFLGLDHLKRLKINTGNSDWAARSLEIGVGAFETVPLLTSLDLGSNNMWSLPQNLLCELRFLGILNLTKNLLSDIDDLGVPHPILGADSVPAVTESITCLLELKMLDLSYNTLRRLGSRRLENLKRLEDLRLQHNWLQEVDDEALFGLGGLKSLNLSSNRLVALPVSFFQNSKSLRSIDLSNNSISALAPGLLSGLDWLVVLDLSRNSLSSQWITVEAFRGLVRLVILNLSYNHLTHLTAESFRDLYTLQVIDLSQNLISSIADSTFMPMSNLHSLNLSKNKLVSISGKMFNGLFVLHKLSLDFNQISKIEQDAMKNCTSLSDLGLAGNLLTEVPPALRGLQYLKTLDLGENKVEKLSNFSFSGMSQLYGVRLVANQLQEIPSGICDPISDLRVFNVAQNNIQAVASDAFVSCPDLRVLRLDSNSLQSFPVNLSPQVPKLLWLNVSQNQIDKVDYSMLPASLEWFDISHNQLESLSGAWSSGATVGKSGTHHTMNHHNAKLRVVDASHNRLTQLTLNSVPPSLDRLIVSHNLLTKVLPDTFSRSGHLRRVELTGNQLQSLPLSALRLQKIPALQPAPEFFLGGNPFLCDCDMEYLLRLTQLSLTRHYPIVLDLDAIMCRLGYTPSLTHKPLPEMKPEQFLCPYKFHCFQTCQCCDFDACDCSMTCPENCTCHHDDSWTTNVVVCANTNLTSVPPRIPMDSTAVYLDGNYMPVVKSHSFIGRKSLRSLFLNASQIETVSNKSFNGLQSLEYLHLDSNRLRRLHGYEFDQLFNLKELYLQNNQLELISNSTFLALKSLEILRLDGNRLRAFPVWQLSLNPYLVEISLSRNLWQCDCAYLHQMSSWVGENSQKVIDLREIRCAWNHSLAAGPLLTEYNSSCGSSWAMSHAYPHFHETWIPLVVALATGLTLLVIVVMVTFLCRRRMQVWCHTKYGVRWCHSTEQDFGSEKSFDAYFLYSGKDEEFVTSRIADELETNESYRLCLHYRDLMIENGESLNESMVSALERSRSLVIVVSPNWLQGEWSSTEYRAGFVGMVKSCGVKSVLVVLMEPVAITDLPDLRTVTPVTMKWSDTKFWPKFKYALPDPSGSQYHSNVTSQTSTSSAVSTETDKRWEYPPSNFVTVPPHYRHPHHGDADIPSFLFQPHAKSPVPFGNFGKKHSSSSTPGGESYLSLEGEHVYSTLDPPTPPTKIHLPNGFTYTPGPTGHSHQWQSVFSPKTSLKTGLRRKSSKESSVPPTHLGGSGGSTVQTYLV